MIKKMQILFFIICLASINVLSANDDKEIIKASKEELNRVFTELKKQSKPAYFISYNIVKTKNSSLSASYGNLETKSERENRTVDIDLRVGDSYFDNTHQIRGSAMNFSFDKSSFELPLESDPEAYKNTLWYLSNASYKGAIEKLEKAITNKKVKAAEEDSSADFSLEPVEKYYEEPSQIIFDLNNWEKTIKNVSAVFNEDKTIFDCKVFISADENRKIIINTEGTEIAMNENYFRVFISAKTKAEDGMSLPLYKSFFAFTPEKLPTEEVLIAAAKEVLKKLQILRNSQILPTYSGPAILSGEASGVFFHEIFGHRVEGHRQKDPNSSQTFKNYLNKKVLPDFMDVYFDPTMKLHDNREISGYYLYDDQGVKSQRVTSVKDGVFKDFLMSRSPIENFSKSNGHGRKQNGYAVVSRQSNLIVQTQKSESSDELRTQLIEECKKQNLEYGLLFETVQGGFTFTGRSIPNSFNVNPLTVYKIYVDGKPDELVRGVDLIGTPLTTFSNIIAADNKIGIFNGICGAESGGVPVSASSPALLVSKIEVQKKAKSQAKPPVLAAP
jgi:predicted Zn-dependent protease